MVPLKKLLEAYRINHSEEVTTDEVLDFLENSGSIDENNFKGQNEQHVQSLGKLT